MSEKTKKKVALVASNDVSWETSLLKNQFQCEMSIERKKIPALELLVYWHHEKCLYREWKWTGVGYINRIAASTP